MGICPTSVWRPIKNRQCPLTPSFVILIGAPPIEVGHYKLLTCAPPQPHILESGYWFLPKLVENAEDWSDNPSAEAVGACAAPMRLTGRSGMRRDIY